jgi:hypothetical protein
VVGVMGAEIVVEAPLRGEVERQLVEMKWGHASPNDLQCV